MSQISLFLKITTLYLTIQTLFVIIAIILQLQVAGVCKIVAITNNSHNNQQNCLIIATSYQVKSLSILYLNRAL